MTNPHDLSLTPLARQALLPLQGGSGKGVGVFSGLVWITEEGGPDDHVLGPGDSMVLRRPGLAIVEALQDSQVILFDTGAARRHAAGAEPLRTSAHAVPGSRYTCGAATRTGEAPRLSLAAYERIARELRRQAMADAVHRLLQALGRLFSPPATLPAPPRPRRPDLTLRPLR